MHTVKVPLFAVWVQSFAIGAAVWIVGWTVLYAALTHQSLWKVLLFSGAPGALACGFCAGWLAVLASMQRKVTLPGNLRAAENHVSRAAAAAHYDLESQSEGQYVYRRRRATAGVKPTLIAFEVSPDKFRLVGPSSDIRRMELVLLHLI